MRTTRKIRHGTIRAHLLAGIAAVALLGVGVGGWAATTELAGAIVAPGVVVVDSNVKKIQHPTGGIIRELLVHNGDVVKTGQVIVRLDDTQARANLAIHAKRLDELMARQARDEAERDGAERIVFPEELMKRIGDPDVARLIAAQERLFNVRRKAREGQKAQLDERIAQLRQGVTGLVAQEAAKVKEIEWIGKELEGIMTLWQKNLVQFTRVVSLQRDLARAEGDHGQLIASTAENKNKIAEIELQIIQIDQDLRSEVGKELATIRAEIAETTEQKIASEDVFSRIEIRAPQDGTVHEMSVHTVGGVVAAGESMMLIVPAGDNLDVEVKVPPEAIDQVYAGQKAVLRFSAFNQRTTPEIDGIVTVVSADLVQDPKTNERYFSARIAIPEPRFRELQLTIIPGMPVEAFIRTGDRTVVSYLMKPLSDQINKVFRER
jgi:HlyD family secretion protein